MKLILDAQQIKEALGLYLEHVLNQEHGEMKVICVDHAFDETTVTFTQEPKK